jgi:hypothetical protein
MDKLPQMGEDAFKDGFLSKQFGNRIIDRMNRDWQVFLPPGAGSGRVIESDLNICLDLTKAKLGWDGTWNQPSPPPYLPPWNLYPTMRGTLAIPFGYDSGTGTWTCTNINHGLELNSPVTIALTTAGTGTMSSAFSTATTYYARDITASTLKLSATAGGAAITGGTNGSGMTLVYAGLALKINPISTLMRTWSYRSSWELSTWKDKADVSNFTNTFILTKADHVIWLEVAFSSGTMTSYAIKSGAPWDSNLPYVNGDNTASVGGAFTWYQLLACLKLSSDPGGEGYDIKISGSWYKLIMPTTTHLMQGYILGYDTVNDDYKNPGAFFAIVPWYGCQWNGS